jgi:ABC-2 type transport system ATP-binding protein
MNDEVVIETRNLKKTFRDFWRRPTVEAVRGLTLSVRRGEVFGLLGPNGSGKSTTIKMLLGLLHPTAGEIRMLGARASSAAVRERIGYLPENSYLHRFLSPRETLMYYASLFGMPRKQAQTRTAELIRMVGLEHAADRAVGGFSKGMARRVGLAQALINAPELLILDEPTSGLDPVGCREVKDMVRLLAGSGVSVLMSSHLLADVEDICDRVAVLARGELRAEGSVSELLRKPEAVRYLVEGLNDAQCAALREVIEAQAGRPVKQDFPAMSLEAFFLQVVAAEDLQRAFEIAPFLRKRRSEGERNSG